MKLNNRVVIVALSVVTVVVCAAAMVLVAMAPKPHGDGRREGRIDVRSGLQALQYEAIEEALELSEEQAEPFKALYEEYVKAAASQRPLNHRSDSVEMSDEQMERMIRESFSRSRKAIDLKERYYRRFREILTPTQISVMYEVERRTREHFVSELERREKRRPKQAGDR